MALAAVTNAILVRRVGMRRLSHMALIGYIATAAALSLWAALAEPPLLATSLLLSVLFFMFGLVLPNFNAIAMQPQAAIAGMAAALTGSFTTLLGATLGLITGQMFDGTVLPLALGFLIPSLVAFTAVAMVEGRNGLFRGE